MTSSDPPEPIPVHIRDENLNDLKAWWERLLEEEEAAFQRACDLDHQAAENTAEKSEAVRHWWQVVNRVVWTLTQTRTQLQHDLQPFPSSMLGRLANISKDLSNGIVPSLVEEARHGRGRPWHHGERHHIAFGVLYIEAVRRGEIDDKAPNQTVRRAINVTKKAVQGWMKRRDETCVGVPFRAMTPEQLRAKMLECGGVYSRAGRGDPSEN